MEKYFRVNKVRIDEVKEFHADIKVEWLRSILLELLNDCGHGAEDLENSSINLKVKLDKEHFDEYGEVLFCEGKISVKYCDVCVKTGDSITQELEIPVSSVFLEHHNEKKHKLDDEISIFFGEQEWDLYYYKNNMANFMTVVHEYVFLNKNPYPGINNE